MATLETLQAWLAEAENALHSLTVGAQRVSMERAGTKITYTAASIPSLKAYITSLKSQISFQGGVTGDENRPRRSVLYNQF